MTSPHLHCDFVYSITAHEHIESVFGMYENIIRYHPGRSCLVIVHCEEALYAKRGWIPKLSNLLFNPNCTKKARFSASIFLAHLDNYRLAIEEGIIFKFFCTLSSNNLFVHPVDMDFIEKETSVLEPGPTGYSLGDKEMWMWEEFLKNERLVRLFQERDIAVAIAPHPGTYYRKEVIGFISDFCKEHGVDINMFPNDVFGAEEVMFPSLEKYATGRVSKRYAVCLYGMTEKDVLDVASTGTCRSHSEDHYTIVRVDRNPANPLRKAIVEGLPLSNPVTP